VGVVKAGISAIVLAAGAGRRMGGPKALAPWAGGTFLDAVLETLGRVPAITERIVVLGADAARVAERVPPPGGVTYVVNERWGEAGMLGSVRCGLDACAPAGQPGPGAILIWPVDHPAVQPATIEALVRAADRVAAVPVHRGRRGHPILVGQAAHAAVRSGDLPEGLRSLVRGLGERVHRVPVSDPAVTLGVDTPDDLERLRRS
jgi:CTP:molybdopterin cytidylyltransferase MocA